MRPLHLVIYKYNHSGIFCNLYGRTIAIQNTSDTAEHLPERNGVNIPVCRIYTVELKRKLYDREE